MHTTQTEPYIQDIIALIDGDLSNPETLEAFQAYHDYELAKALPNAGLELVITNTLLGNASRDDMKIIDNLISTIFHTQRKNESYSVFEDVF